MADGSMTIREKTPFTFTPDGKLDGPITSEMTGDATVVFDDPSTGLTGFIVSGNTSGADVAATFTGASGGQTLQQVFTISITDAPATTLGGVLGQPVAK